LQKGGDVNGSGTRQESRFIMPVHHPWQAMNPTADFAHLKQGSNMTRKLVAMLAFSLAGLAAAASAQAQAPAQEWVAGKHYSIIATQRTNVPAGKVEVMEVFSYGCPACNAFLPTMKKLKAALPANAQLVYLPASWNKGENWPLFQRAYFTAQSLGVAEKAHEGMFGAIWSTGELGVTDASGHLKSTLPSIEDAARFYERVTGVKAAAFVNASKSFGVDLKMRQADSQIIAMQVDGTPTLVVNGKYRLNSQNLKTPEQYIELIKYLVARESAPAAAPAKKS
jgi:thiol:disulfide interchange protein DsbA